MASHRSLVGSKPPEHRLNSSRVKLSDCKDIQEMYIVEYLSDDNAQVK